MNSDFVAGPTLTDIVLNADLVENTCDDEVNQIINTFWMIVGTLKIRKYGLQKMMKIPVNKNQNLEYAFSID